MHVSSHSGTRHYPNEQGSPQFLVCRPQHEQLRNLATRGLPAIGPSNMCYHAEFGRFVLKIVVNTEPQRPERWNSALLGWDAWLTPRYMLRPPPRVTTSYLVVLRA